MNLIKNFGGMGGTSKPVGATPLSTKNNYFSTLKLDDSSAPKPKVKDQSKPSQKRGPPKQFTPNKFALSFDPPCIILEYQDTATNKLYHHKMPLKKLKKETNIKQALEYLRKRHKQYFAPKVIDEGQIEKLIEKLQKGLVQQNKSHIEQVEEEEDFQFDYDDDFDDL